MEGFIFQIKGSYYFIETNYKNKTKTIANRFLDYFLNDKFDGCGFIPLNVIQNTFNKIYKEMRKVNIRLSNDKTVYFIHEPHAGATIDKDELTIIKEVI